MTDWNPAEIIGIRPKPLALSLYTQLISNDVWAQQRAEFGYRDVRPMPLISSFSGQPYVDIRASINSFIPKGLDDQRAERIVEAYMEMLEKNPHFHDKVEFDIAFTIWLPDFKNIATTRFQGYNINSQDINELEMHLLPITRAAIQRLENDTSSIQTLKHRREKLLNCKISHLDRALALLDDCKRFGTLAFAHAARAGFVANTFLKHFVETGIMTQTRHLEFMGSIETVTSSFKIDQHAYLCGEMSLDQLVELYGHLRPGTYDVTAQAYWEKPSVYLAPSENEPISQIAEDFMPNATERTACQDILNTLDLEITPEQLFIYFAEAIKAREAVKFEFTKNLSLALDNIIRFAEKQSLSREQVSYLTFHDLEQIKLNAILPDVLQRRIKQRMHDHITTQLIELPNIISSKTDFFCFERMASQPNFVTNKSIRTSAIELNDTAPEKLKGKIVLIEQADPGYDWILGCNIAGLITKYGGANSHMAIRSAELGLPAAIGIGDQLFEQLSHATVISLDCKNQILRDVL